MLHFPCSGKEAVLFYCSCPSVESATAFLGTHGGVFFMTKTEWRPVVGYEGFYEVSSIGEVRSVERVVRNGSRSGWRTVRAHVLKPETSNAGYLRVVVSRDSILKHLSVHRIVADAFCAKTCGSQVNHVDGVKTHNAARNLEWVSAKENVRHAASLGLRDGLRAKRVMREGSGTIYKSVKECAVRLGLRHQSISRVCRGERRHYLGEVFYYV